MKTLRLAFGYLRVSSLGQSDEDKDGLVRQKAAIKKWAAANGVYIRQWFQDTLTGKTELDCRPGLQSLMAALHADGVKLVIVEKLDRLARDLMISESIVKDIQRNGFELASTCEPDLCSTDPTRVLIRQILSAFSEYEAKMIVLKLRGSRERARAKDPTWQEGRKRFGFRAGEPETIARVLELHAAGNKLPAIVRTLNAEGRKTRMGKQWFPKQVADILKRAKV